MSDDNAKITITTSREFKRTVKAAVIAAGYDNFQEGYSEILKAGIKNLKNKGEKIYD